MSLKSILTYWDSNDRGDGRTSTAVELARRFDGHLTVAALACDPDIPPSAFGTFPGIEMAEIYQQSRTRAEALANEATGHVERQGIKGEATALVTTYAGLAAAFGRLARFADLVVLSQPAVSGSAQAATNLLEGALFDGDAATLVCPAGVAKLPGERILIGWNGDREALRAVRRAMPLLRGARTVEIAVVDPGGGAGEPGADLAVFLARHGIGVDITTHARAGQGVGELLLRRAVDIDADLLVMGAYGHSRFREYVLGGVTREMLEDAPVPVLMAH